MRRLILISTVLIFFMLSAASVVHSEGTGVKVYAPSDTSVEADMLPFSYNDSFVVFNDGREDGVYVIRVSVDDPAVMPWINVSPVAFVLSPGESKRVQYSLNVSPEQAKTGRYAITFIPTLLPRNVEPYLDTFARYVSYVDYYNLTFVLPPINGYVDASSAAGSGTPVVFTEEPGRVNLIQYSQPLEGNMDAVEIDRAVRVNAPGNATVGQPVQMTISVFEGLSSRGIDLIAVSPDGLFYPITGENFTFTEDGKWGVIAAVGDQMLIGKPITVGNGGAEFAMPGMDTILAAIAFLLLLSIIPIWILTRDRHADPYKDISFKAYVIQKYIDQFDTDRLKRAVGMIEEEYYGLVSEDVPGDRDAARASLDELKTLTRLESSP